MKYVVSLLLVLGIVTITLGQLPTQGEGFVNVEGGRIWYKVVGEGGGTPLLIIHGGPGGRSCGSIPVYSRLSDERPVIFYDQLGSGNSDRPSDTLLWQLPRFVNEIESLRNELGLKELHIMGNSWGAALLAEYLFAKNPQGVKSVIFSGPLLSTPVWAKDASILLSELPSAVRDTITKYENLKVYNAPAYIAATDSFYSRYLSRNYYGATLPPECDNALEFNEDVYNYMWGPTEFTPTGTLKNFDRTSDLYTLKCPVLFIGGEFDEARPETLYKFQKLVPGSKVIILENAGHATYIDQPDKKIEAIREFLHEVELKE
jgi:proline iminopeptidase